MSVAAGDYRQWNGARSFSNLSSDFSPPPPPHPPAFMRPDVLVGTLTIGHGLDVQGVVFRFTRNKRFCQLSKTFEPTLVPTKLPTPGGGGGRAVESRRCSLTPFRPGVRNKCEFMARDKQIYCRSLSFFLCTNVDVTKHAMGVMDNISFNLPSSSHIFLYYLRLAKAAETSWPIKF
jgi:hypothetical protein